ncbi:MULTISPECIES: phage tail protein I [unclassified Sphingomonas]|uniref:phage tail protein I n=1 Tax=unclassified Sphingomonas TaxID=196159 RepID=UPI00226A3A2B|nr:MULTISPECIES: phage tail protein I [unclassified Sphingomonas]
MLPSLLPPNATPLERALEGATARVGAIDIAQAAELWNPATCPAPILPWLAWSLSVDFWDPAWSDAVKREAVATSIAKHRRKGTRTSVEEVLARYDELLRVIEWFKAVPPAQPHTFEIQLDLVTAEGVAPGGLRSSAAFAEAIIRDVTRVKPLREHFILAQTLRARAAVGIFGVARLAGFVRERAALVSDTSPFWDPCLQSEDGEPFQDDLGTFFEDLA